MPAIAFVLTGLLIPVVQATAVTSQPSYTARHSQQNDIPTATTWQQAMKVLVAGAVRNDTCHTASVLQVRGKAAGGIVKGHW